MRKLEGKAAESFGVMYGTYGGIESSPWFFFLTAPVWIPLMLALWAFAIPLFLFSLPFRGAGWLIDGVTGHGWKFWD